MKNIFKSTIKIVTLLLAVCAIFILPACNNDYPDAYKPTKGKPTVDYIRLPDVNKSDSLLTHAFMGTTIALMGQNLTSIKEVWFNDQKAVLNTSLITSTTLIVTVKTVIPKTVTNKMYLVTTSSDTISIPFTVDVPAPVVSSMKCEMVSVGETAVINGDFFLDDPNIPLQVIFPGNIPATKIISIAKTQIQVEVPAGATIPGQINVKSLYGNGRSSFWFLDNRGIILNYDNLTTAGSWRGGTIKNDANSLDKNYLMLKGTLGDNVGSEDFTGGGFVSELWGDANGRPNANFLPGPKEDYLFKFEARVITWTGAYLNICWGPWASSVSPYQNQLYWSNMNARGLWRPWETNGTGEFKTDGWITVTIPMADMKYDKDFKTFEFDPSKTGSLTFWMKGPSATAGANSDIEIYIDNVRIVPQ